MLPWKVWHRITAQQRRRPICCNCDEGLLAAHKSNREASQSSRPIRLGLVAGTAGKHHSWMTPTAALPGCAPITGHRVPVVPASPGPSEDCRLILIPSGPIPSVIRLICFPNRVPCYEYIEERPFHHSAAEPQPKSKPTTEALRHGEKPEKTSCTAEARRLGEEFHFEEKSARKNTISTRLVGTKEHRV